jgi:hypothetical protein
MDKHWVDMSRELKKLPGFYFQQPPPNESLKATIIAFVSCLALVVLLASCSQRENDIGANKEAFLILSSHFNAVITNEWSVVRSLKTTVRLRGKTTRYFFREQGTQKAFEATLQQLNGKNGANGSLVHGVIREDRSASDECSWWHPEQQGEGYYGVFDVEDKQAHYYWNVALFTNGTNASLFSDLTVIE